jgi:Ni/Co efflux regulator RcnB
MNRRILFATLATAAVAAASVAAAQTPYQQQQRDYQQALQHNQQQQQDYQHAQRQWARGQRLPSSYRTHGHMVRDYGHHGWRRPPHGYAYYTTDNGDVVMAAIATGVISSIIVANSDDHRGDGRHDGYSHR